MILTFRVRGSGAPSHMCRYFTLQPPDNVANSANPEPRAPSGAFSSPEPYNSYCSYLFTQLDMVRVRYRN
jgi:hypothetical protein